MMRLTQCKFEGLPGFKTLDLDDIDAITTLIGPNGAGKSSILRVLHLAISIVNRETIYDNLPEHDTWHRFTAATLRFRSYTPKSLRHFAEHLGETIDEVEIKIKCDESTFLLQSVRCGDRTMEFPQPQVTRTAITQQEDTIAQTASQLKDFSSKDFNQMTPDQRNRHPEQTEQLKKRLEQQKLELATKDAVIAKVSNNETSLQFTFREIDAFLADFEFPSVVVIPARQSPDIAIPMLIGELMKLKKGRKNQFAEYTEATARLSHLLQADVDLSEVDGPEELHINGVPYQKASSGTETTLAFFGLTRLGKPNCLILWDEPENGLHPTRRSRLLDLMFNDKRQFILATHASELAPVFNSQGAVFQCSSFYDSSDFNVRLSVQRVANRRDAFVALEALGVHPAKTLFTTNVVIWVEGPTELFFYRHWLGARLTKHNITEGFHYTFMQYGGALISYLSAADECQFESAFDLLSLCRHPVIIVDSDLRKTPGDRIAQDFLKPGAARLLQNIEELNKQRPNAALFRWTDGREIENYLPVSAIVHAIRTLWKDAAKYPDLFEENAFTVEQYDSYHSAITNYLVKSDLTDENEINPDKPLAKGRSIWGPNNKVKMMRCALTSASLTEAQLQWNCSKLLDTIEQFVLSKCESNEHL